MKILYSGYHNPHFLSMPDYIESAIKGLGHELEVHDFYRWFVPGRIRDRFAVINSWDMQRINNDLISRARKFKPDLVLVNGGWTISPETITRVKEVSGAVTASWIADFPRMFYSNAASGPFYDYFFASGTDALGKYIEAGNKNGHWLPFACDPELHRPVCINDVDRKKYSCDICFVGSLYPERIEALERLSGFNLGIWGLGWERLPSASPLVKFIRGGVVSLDEWVKIFKASKIVLNIVGHSAGIKEPHFDEEVFKCTNTKVFEILSCGCFQIVEGKADVLSLFKDKEHLAVYHDFDELPRIIEYYLGNDHERERIAENGRREVLLKHTYVKRIEEILTVIKNG